MKADAWVSTSTHGHGKTLISVCGLTVPQRLGRAFTTMEGVHVISVSSLKGGVGKTTVALGLASAAFSAGLRTLVVDLDPQSDVSTGLDVAAGDAANIADVLTEPKRVREAIVSSGWNQHHEGHIDLLLGSPSAINFDGPHPSMREIWRLEEALSLVEKDYDLVIIDCAPSLNALTRTAWAASDRVLVVTEPGLFAVAAADRALRAIDELRRGVSPRLEPLGIVINRARPKSAEHQFRIRELREMFGQMVVDPIFPERTSIQQAQGAAKPLHVWPGETTQEMAKHFDTLLGLAMTSLNITPPRSPKAPTQVVAADVLDDFSDTESVVTDRAPNASASHQTSDPETSDPQQR